MAASWCARAIPRRTVDLAHLAGLAEAGVLGELVNDDGTVKRLPQLVAFAREHDLKIVSIADLIAYRRAREKLVDRISESAVDTAIGPARAISYATRFDTVHHLALIYGDIGAAEAVPVRIHRQDVLSDVFGRSKPNLIAEFARRHEARGRRVLVYLREGATGVAPAEPQPSAAKRERLWREVGVGAQILKDLGLTRITLLTTHKLDYVGLAGYDIELAATEIIGAQSSA
ncbi:MAG: 3,4-dihydroxy-2-butanone-4-phosphate synthase [Rhizomicrobium sp.]